jgi:hypothetical protein
MRRILATLLIAIIASGFVLPAAMTAVEDSAPACCRRNGKHHCLMPQVWAREGSAAKNLPRIQAPASVCPYYDPIRTTRTSAEARPQANIPDVPVVNGFVLSVQFIPHGLQFVNSALTRGPPLLP